MVEDNSHAGQGAVMLDIGGDIGALIVTMPAEMEGIEIEIRPIDGPALDAHEAQSQDAHSREAHSHEAHSHDADSHDAHSHEAHSHEAHSDEAHSHDAHSDEAHSHDAHSHEAHSHGAGHLIHVAVVGRPGKDGLHYSAVYSELIEGSYELYVRPAGPVQLTASVVGGAVTEEVWPS